ncbi:helix-turn-helix transcriptional regulator [Streptomyces sp. NPDC056723]|uniref:helix-turn-helix domain-containing protein n=1 Tax=Streptomyces sp. NPDC056723 TaxID=3345925 RepID=UPI00367B8C6C
MSAPTRGAELTDNELAVLQRAAHGETYAVIAQRLGYKEKSVSKMALRLARKLGARNISHAVHLATAASLIGTSPDCGDRAAYLRHLRRGEDPCAPCRAANARHAVAQRAGQLAKEATG